jgi:hypothetical protein
LALAIVVRGVRVNWRLCLFDDVDEFYDDDVRKKKKKKKKTTTTTTTTSSTTYQWFGFIAKESFVLIKGQQIGSASARLLVEHNVVGAGGDERQFEPLAANVDAEHRNARAGTNNEECNKQDENDNETSHA